MITIEELHKKTLPEHKRVFVKIDIISYYLCRPICDYLTILLLNTNISANTITIFSAIVCIIALLFFVFSKTVIGFIFGFLLLFVWNICDGIDGNIARYTDTCSKKGDLWDAFAGYLAMFVFFYGAGFVASKEVSFFQFPFLNSSSYVAMGGFSGMAMLFPRLITQKKESVYGKKSSENFKNRNNFSFSKKVAANVISINGLASLLLFLAIIFKLVNIFVIIYTFVLFLFLIVSCFSIMKGL